MRARLSSVLALSSSLLVLLAIAPPVLAEKGDAYVGYTRTGSDPFYFGTGSLNGWDVALHIKLHPFLGGEGDVSGFGMGSDSSTPRTTTFLFGPRVTLGAARVHVFGHALFGGEHSSSPDGSISGTAFAFALGGGVDVPFAPFFAWRFGGDFIEAPTQAPSDSTPARFTTGIVFRF